MSYRPHKKQRQLLARALELIDSVPYRVTLRWVFYRLLQEGFYEGKDGYKKCKYLLAKARKRFYGGGPPIRSRMIPGERSGVGTAIAMPNIGSRLSWLGHAVS